MKTNEERLEDLLSHLNSLGRIHVEDIPKIDLYMDQVTTFMESHLESMKRYPDDKVLTKTMINNYAKNNLLPPPVRKKYTQEHILLLIFIYYFKNLLNFNDIETILSYITEHHFGETQVPLSRVYTEIFSMEHGQMDRLQEDVREKFKTAQKIFTDTEEPERDALQLFAFICELAFDVYLKKQMIERLADQIREENPPSKKK
ncbi:MAG TPA: DUF1836 domain-containing protein [Candidatus Copromonas faecavium]|uniref:DUF1836 domain-containing protein n=1 Tax=Candidatus Copromonas faecavium (nom. illeg.) TaxID=2840740 RepID=A0A9D1A5M5_9FIRM|nr:DUF1836 domain-containing protein [Candidatus Copromonas faecavium]